MGEGVVDLGVLRRLVGSGVILGVGYAAVGQILVQGCAHRGYIRVGVVKVEDSHIEMLCRVHSRRLVGGGFDYAGTGGQAGRHDETQDICGKFFYSHICLQSDCSNPVIYLIGSYARNSR